MGIPPECWEGPFRPMVARPSTVDELLTGALTNCDTELTRVRCLLGELLAERERLRETVTELWHDANSGHGSLHECLGMKWEQYQEWVTPRASLHSQGSAE